MAAQTKERKERADRYTWKPDDVVIQPSDYKSASEPQAPPKK